MLVRCALPLMCDTQHAKKHLKDGADRPVTTGSKAFIDYTRHSVDGGVRNTNELGYHVSGF